MFTTHYGRRPFPVYVGIAIVRVGQRMHDSSVIALYLQLLRGVVLWLWLFRRVPSSVSFYLCIIVISRVVIVCILNRVTCYTPVAQYGGLHIMFRVLLLVWCISPAYVYAA